jgi:hypothetical protein
MKTRILPIFLATISTIAGCAQRQTIIPRGQDPSALETAIVQRGQGEAPSETVRPSKNHLGPILKTTVRVVETCGVVCFLGAFIVASDLAKGNSDTSNLPSCEKSAEDRGEGLTGLLGKIWSEDP